jgi:hypothetical protein
MKNYKVVKLDPNHPDNPLNSDGYHGDKTGLEEILNNLSKSGWEFEGMWNNLMILSKQNTT